MDKLDKLIVNVYIMPSHIYCVTITRNDYMLSAKLYFVLGVLYAFVDIDVDALIDHPDISLDVFDKINEIDITDYYNKPYPIINNLFLHLLINSMPIDESIL